MNSLISYQLTDMSNVKPEYKFREEKVPGIGFATGFYYVAYINSPAGHITYRTRHYYEMSKFRDDVINKMDTLIKSKATIKEYFKLYKVIRANYKVKFKANIHTRLKSLYVF